MKTSIGGERGCFNSVLVEQSYYSLFAIIFVVSAIAKGGVVFKGFAVDDYGFSFALNSGELGVFVGQGRYISAGIVWAINSIGVNISDTYLAFGILALVLQSAFVVSILRFVGADKYPSAALIGALVVTHPYFAEILTFRMALPFYCASLVFSIISLELIAKDPTSWRMRILAFCSTLAMLFTYQSFLNYFAVLIIFSLILARLVDPSISKEKYVGNHNQRGFVLMMISLVAMLTFLVTSKLLRFVGLTSGAGRANFIDAAKIPERMLQMKNSLIDIYWTAQPIMPHWIKVLILVLGLVSFVFIIITVKENSRSNNVVGNITVVFLLLLLLIPVSLGVIIPFGDWWPVPRVIAHVSLIIALLFMVGDLCYARANTGALGGATVLARILIVSAFVLIGNQIFSDQLRINQWDRNMANRIVTRLEMSPGFENMRYLHISGGHWGFPAGLRTVMGDMNISAFLPDYSKFNLIADGSGYKFDRATGVKSEQGEAYCMGKPSWPHVESIALFDNLGVVCLKKP